MAYDSSSWLPKKKQPQAAQVGYTPKEAPMSKGTPVGTTGRIISSTGGGISSGPNQNYSPVQQAPIASYGQPAAQAQVSMMPTAAVAPQAAAEPAAKEQRFKNDFFTTEGQKERLQNVADVMRQSLTTIPFTKPEEPITANTGISGLNTVLEYAANKPYEAALDIAAVTQLFRAVGSAILQMDKIGAVALTPGGAEALAATIPEATGKVATQAAGKVVANTVTKSNSIKTVTSLLSTRLPAKNTVAGFLVRYGIIGAAAGTGYNIMQSTNIKSKKLDYIADSHELIQKLMDAGQYEQAEEIMQNNKDLEDGLKSIIGLIPVYGSVFKKNLIEDYIAQLADDNLDYDTSMARSREAEANQKEIDEKVRTAEGARLIQLISGMSDEDIISNAEVLTFLADPLNQGSTLEKLYYGAYNRYNNKIQQEEQRKYEESQTAEQRAYNEQQKQEQRTYDEANQPAPEVYSPASTLNVGILHTPGGSESVGSGGGIPGATGTATTGTTSTGDTGTTAAPDKDAIAIYLFGKHYVELTPEQRSVVDKW